MSLAGRLALLYRFAAVLFGVVLFGAIGGGYRLLLLPFMPRGGRSQPLQRRLRARRLVSASWRLLVRYLVVARVLSVRFEGLERLGRPGQLIVANHPSLLDVVFLVAYVPEVNCIVKQDLLKNPTMKGPIAAAGYILNDASDRVLALADTVLRNGETLLVFPEGTRTGHDGVIRFNRGAVSIGLRSATVITPVVIRMSPPVLKKGQPWYEAARMRIRYEFIVGEDLDPAAWLAEKPLPIASRRLNRYLQDYFSREVSQ